MTEPTMESLKGKYSLGKPVLRVALVLLVLASVGVSFSPWGWLRTVAFGLQMFCGGVLFTQQTSIWVKTSATEEPPPASRNEG